MLLFVAGLPAPPRSFMVPPNDNVQKKKSCKKELIATYEEKVSRYFSSPWSGVIIIP